MANNERISVDTFRALQEVFALAEAQVMAMAHSANSALFGAWSLTEGERDALEQTMKTARVLEHRLHELKNKVENVTDWNE